MMMIDLIITALFLHSGGGGQSHWCPLLQTVRGMAPVRNELMPMATRPGCVMLWPPRCESLLQDSARVDGLNINDEKWCRIT